MTHILPCECNAEKDGLQIIEAGTIAAQECVEAIRNLGAAP